MGRKRIDHGTDGQAKIALLMSGGHGADRIAAELGVSVATAKRRMREIKGVVTEVKGESRQTRRAAVRLARPAPTAVPGAAAGALPDVAESALDGDDDSIVIPEGSSLEQIDRWLKVAEDEAAAAAGDDDPDNHIKWVRLAASLIEARRKAAPIAKTDPNEQPDMIAAAARARKRLHALANKLAYIAASPLAESIGKLVNP